MITTELPFLISKEFSAIEVDGAYNMKSSSEVVSNNATAAMHQARWRALFDQLDSALSEEEKQLVSVIGKTSAIGEDISFFLMLQNSTSNIEMCVCEFDSQ